MQNPSRGFAPLCALADKAGLISLRNVTRHYKSGARPVHAVDGVSLEIASGEFVAVTGPSGCGKSTLMHLIAGLDTPSAGEIEVDGLALHATNDAALTEYRRRRLGLVFQFFNLLPTMNVLENVGFPLLLQGVPNREVEERARSLLELVGMADRAGHLVHQPSLLIADEPTGNLDSTSAALVLAVLRRIAEERRATLLVVTHSEAVA